ncbi:MAG: ABC transporter permease [Planctomycetota bacterium]
MFDSLYIAWKHLCFHKVKTLILVAAISVTLFLPAGVDALVDECAQQLRQRAAQTPLLIGAKGSETELVLNSLYFESNPPADTSMKALERVQSSGYAEAIPLYVRFRAREKPVVGTTLDYFSFRELRVGAGRQFAMLGECVLGVDAADQLELRPGQSLLSQSENVFDLAGAYPLRMNVVGVLEPSGSPDDSAVFVDVKTAWIIAGLGHGHQDLGEDASSDSLLEKDGQRLTANASVPTYTEITSANVASFHFHGDPVDFPLTGVLAVPEDRRSRALLRGRFQGTDEASQIVEPSAVMEKLLATILRVRTIVLVGALLLSVATTLVVVLVFALSLRIRRQELETMRKIGATRFAVFLIVAWEILVVLGLSGGIAVSLTFLTRQLSGPAIRWFLL